MLLFWLGGGWKWGMGGGGGGGTDVHAHSISQQMTQTIQTRAQSIYFASELCNSTLLCACIYIFSIMEKIHRWYMIPLQRRLQNATGKTHFPISPQFRCSCSQRDGDTWWRVASTIYHSHLTHYSAGDRISSALTNWNQHWQDFWGGEKTRRTKNNNRGMLFIHGV